jgi:hypothetical protein
MSGVDAYELAYREARALEQQRATATELRGRASALIATASITVSLLGPRTFVSTPFGWLAVACFVALSIFVLTVIWPRADWRSGGDPRELLAVSSSSSATMALRLIGDLAEDPQGNATEPLRRSARQHACSSHTSSLLLPPRRALPKVPAMDADRDAADLDLLYHPGTPNPAVSLVTGQLIRDMPPRRTLRERARALLGRLHLLRPPA